MDKKIIKELLTARDAVKKQFEEAQQNHQRMIEKRNELQKSIQPLERAEGEAKKKKMQALDMYVMGTITEEKCNEAKKSHESALHAISAAVELLEAHNRAIPITEKNTPQLQAQFMAAENAIWTYILEDMKTQLNFKGIEAEMGKIWVAAMNSHTVSTYQGFLMSLFPQPPVDEIPTHQREIEDTYGIHLIAKD